jgi:hypothetical protein
MSPAIIAATISPSASTATPGARELLALVIAEPDVGARRRVGTEPVRRDPAHGVVGGDAIRDLDERAALDVGERAGVGSMPASASARGTRRESLVGHGPPATSSAVHTYSLISLTSLSLNLPRDAHDLEVEVHVRRLDVEEAADADHASEVARGDAAELAVALPAQVGRTFEVDLAEPDPVSASSTIGFMRSISASSRRGRFPSGT